MAAQAPATTAEFVALVRRSGLLADVPDDLPDPPDRAAGELVRRRLLTPFQARMLLTGRSRGFVLGDYVIRDQIGQGGMGYVYLGVHRTLGRKAAVKVLPPSIATDQLARQRFLREARTAAALDHPNVVKLYDVARDGEVWYLVMEFVEGRTLEQVVKAEGPLPHPRAAQYVAQAAAGLQHAHEKGFIHRDIKPGNLILTPEGGVKILDMGLARPVGPEGVLTIAQDPGAVVGTADYISPEQVVSDPDLDIRADIYSLGLTFFFLVTGRPPFPGSTAGKLVKQKLAQLPSLEEMLPGFPPGLAAVIAGMTAKEREERYETPADVILALKPWLEQSPKLMAGVSGTKAANDRLSTQALRAEERPPPVPRKRGVPVWVWAVVGGVGLAAVAGGVAVAVALSAKGDTRPTGGPPVIPGQPLPTAPAPADPSALLALDPSALTPSEVTITHEGGQARETPPGGGRFANGWSATTWQPGNRVRAFAAADGLGTQPEKGSAILFAPVLDLRKERPRVVVSLEYRTGAGGKLDLRLRETAVRTDATELKPLPATNGEWRAIEFEFDTSKITSARWEFHNQDTTPNAPFELRKFVVRAVK